MSANLFSGTSGSKSSSSFVRAFAVPVSILVLAMPENAVGGRFANLCVDDLETVDHHSVGRNRIDWIYLTSSTPLASPPLQSSLPNLP
jgi:hypothetical protein